MPARPVLGLTIGDPAGVGPELIERCLLDPGLPQTCDYRVIGDPAGHAAGRPTAASARAAWDALEEAALDQLRTCVANVVNQTIGKELVQTVGFRKFMYTAM